MSDARTFSARLKVLTAMIDKNVEREVRAAGMACAMEVINRTPVKTGRARSNWIGSRYGAIPTNIIEGANTKNRETNRSVATVTAVRNCASTIRSWKREMGSLLISNCVPYIFDLDDGTSGQARQGMTLFGIMAARRRLKQARLLSASEVIE
jgi:hypothetical protein